MRTIFLAATMSVAATLLAVPAVADPVKRVLPQGKDGDYYYYQVKCTNGTEGSVVVQDKEKSICAQALGGERVCSATWNVQRAAEHACQ